MKDDFLIDGFYNENPNSIDKNFKLSSDFILSKEKLEDANKKLDILNQDIFDINIDIISIIEQAENIKESNNHKRELIIFTLLSTFLVSLYALAGFVFGSKVILISQAVLLTILPWVVIPVSIVKRKGSET